MEGDQIVRVRRALGFSQEKLGEILGCSLSAWNRYENGYSKPNKWISQMLRVLEIAARDTRLMGELHGMPADTEPPALLWYLLDKVYRQRLTHEFSR